MRRLGLQGAHLDPLGCLRKRRERARGFGRHVVCPSVEQDLWAVGLPAGVFGRWSVGIGQPVPHATPPSCAQSAKPGTRTQKPPALASGPVRSYPHYVWYQTQRMRR